MSIKEISSIEFGILSAKEILNMSCFEVNTIKRINNNIDGTIYDPRSGLLNKDCEMCGQDLWSCPGHFGHINLNHPLIHPLFFNHVLNMLKIFCYKCSELIVTETHLFLNNLRYLEKEKRLNAVIELIKKYNNCFHCGSQKQVYKIKVEDSKDIFKIDEGQETLLTIAEIQNIFENIKDDYTNLLEISHPKHYILTVFPVIPVCCRPYMVSEGHINDDDLSYQLQEIVKNNENITKFSSDKEKVTKCINTLKFRIETFMNNTQSKAMHTTTGRAVKGLRERISGKNGQIRKNLLGKRCDMSGRTVGGPEPTLRLDEVGIPEYIAKTLTYPVHVTPFNIRHLSTKEAVRVTRDDKNINLTHCNEFILQVGDILHRHLKDGDIISMNRQPTLHKSSMLAHKAKILKGSNIKTFRISLAVTQGYNADFDGDEMNCHVPQSEETKTELLTLSLPSLNIISCQSGKPIVTIVQDGLLGAYLLSKEPWEQTMDVGCFNDILMKLIDLNLGLQRLEEIKGYLTLNTNNYMNGKCLISILLPSNFFYKDQNITIVKGILLSGTLTKEYLGSTDKSLILYLNKEYGSEITADFIDNLQFIVNQWLLSNSFTIHAGDCLIQNNTTKIEDLIQTKLIEANIIESGTEERFKESRIINALSRAKDIGLKLAKDSLCKDNNFIKTVESGSKGSYINICQINGLLGQQNIQGERIMCKLNNFTRTLPHYPLTNLNVSDKFESRGFISSSFAKGLNPKEFFFHSMSGRQGVIDTSQSTSVSGYNSRRMTKLMENIKVGYDGSVNDTEGRRYQYYYNDLGYDPCKLIKVDGVPEVCNIQRLVNRIKNDS